MAVKIKLKRLGKIRAPYYRIVVADSRSARDGRILETIGHYGPRQAPSAVDINGDRAYVVIPADYNFKQNGKPMVETGSVVTLTLRKLQRGWRVSGWAWAKH